MFCISSCQGSPEVCSETTLHVVVLDVNDNPPEFERTSYYTSIREDGPVKQRVVTITATSRDIGVNAELTYSIVAGNEQGKFAVEEKTGERVKHFAFYWSFGVWF